MCQRFIDLLPRLGQVGLGGLLRFEFGAAARLGCRRFAARLHRSPRVRQLHLQKGERMRERVGGGRGGVRVVIVAKC